MKVLNLETLKVEEIDMDMGPTKVDGGISYMGRIYSENIPEIPAISDISGTRLQVENCPVKGSNLCRSNPNCYSCYYYVENRKKIAEREK